MLGEILFGLVESDEVCLGRCPTLVPCCLPCVHFQLCEHVTVVHAARNEHLDLGGIIDVGHLEEATIFLAFVEVANELGDVGDHVPWLLKLGLGLGGVKVSDNTPLIFDVVEESPVSLV